ncbi:unnamed protein product [Prunus armeniaca]
MASRLTLVAFRQQPSRFLHVGLPGLVGLTPCPDCTLLVGGSFGALGCLLPGLDPCARAALKEKGGLVPQGLKAVALVLEVCVRILFSQYSLLLEI